MATNDLRAVKRMTLQCQSVDVAEPAEGGVATLRIVAYTGAPMRLPQWDQPVVVDLAGMIVPSQQLPIRYHHDAYRGVGHTTAVSIEGGQLVVDGVVSRGTPEAAEFAASAQRGFPWKASIGAEVGEVEQLRPGQVAEVNGRQIEGPAYIVRLSELAEISVVDLGADRATAVQIAAQADAGGNSVSDTNPTPQHEQPDHRQDAEYIEAIMRIAGDQPGLAAKAIEEGWTVRQTGLARIRASRPAPVIRTEAQPDTHTQTTLEAALCMHYGVPERVLAQAYGQDVLERASRHRHRGIVETARMLAARHGVALDARPGSGEWIRAAFSLADIAGLVGAVANKAIGAAFEMAEPTVPRIAAAVSHSNFHTHTVYSLAVSGDLQQVAPDGELQHLSLGQESYTRQLATRGAILTVSRQDLINDDLGALTRTAMALANKALAARERLMYQQINQTTTFFTIARNNYFEGATSALSADSLGTAVRMMWDQTTPDGTPLLLQPAILLVPSALGITAKRLMSAQTYIATGVGSTRAIEGADNIWRGAYEVVITPFLGSSALGGSQTAWYLLANPNVMAAFEIAYLNGIQTPTVEFAGLDHDMNRLGVTYRVYWDFGAALAEYRAAVKSKGAA